MKVVNNEQEAKIGPNEYHRSARAFDGRVLVLAGSRVLVSRAGLDGCSVETCSGD